MSHDQFDAQGRLQHLLTLADLPRPTLLGLLDRAQQFHTQPGAAAPEYDLLAGATVVNLFFEASTRTRASFELAARRLGAQVLTLGKIGRAHV